MTEAFFTPEILGFPVKFNEVMYNPIGGSDYEFIELKNISQTEVDLSWHRIKGIDFLFRLHAKIDPGECVLLANDDNPQAFVKRYPRLDVYGWYSGRLANGGEKLTLESPEGQELLMFKYDDKEPWPRANDILGYSINIIDPLADAKNPANWEPNPQKGGTPGK